MGRTVYLIFSLWIALSARAEERILLIGDSHTAQTFGHVMDELLRTIPDSEVATYASCGSHPGDWFTGSPTHCGYFYRDFSGLHREGLEAPTPLLSELMSRLQPSVSLVALGANLMNGSLEFAAETSRQMAQMIHAYGSKCVWIGPPHARIFDQTKFAELYGVLRSVTAPECEFIDTRPFAHYPDTGGDGLHYDRIEPDGPQMSTELAEQAFTEFVRQMSTELGDRVFIEGR